MTINQCQHEIIVDDKCAFCEKHLPLEKKKAFTLIELLVIMVIICMMSIVISGVLSVHQKHIEDDHKTAINNGSNNVALISTNSSISTTNNISNVVLAEKQQ